MAPYPPAQPSWLAELTLPPRGTDREGDVFDVNDAGLEPARVTLARELRGWTQADLARRLGVSPAAVGQFEKGTTRPSPLTLTRLSEVLEVPPGFFSLALVETHEGFFRSLRRTSVVHRRRARALAQLAHDLATASSSSDLPAVSLPCVDVVPLDAPDDVVEAAAASVRRSWKIPRGPVTSVVGTLEEHGVVVMRLPLDTADVDAFSLPFRDRPVVVLSSDKGDRARSRFDASHELGHLVLHGEQLWGLKEIEHQAHGFAAAFLMPAKDIYEELPDRADWPVLFSLKKKWQVSLAALLMRARVLGRMSPTVYVGAVKAASARGWRRTEPVPLGKPEQPQLLQALYDSQTSKNRGSSPLPISAIASVVLATADS